MDKKAYEAPVIRKVHLDVKNAVLAICYSSTASTPFPDCQQPDQPCVFPPA